MKRRQKIPLKFDLRRLDHARLTASKDGKDLIVVEIQKYKKPVLVKSYSLKKNPDKIWIWKPKRGSPYAPTCFTYKGYEDWVYIASHGVCVDLPFEFAVKIAEAIIKYGEEKESEDNPRC